MVERRRPAGLELAGFRVGFDWTVLVLLALIAWSLATGFLPFGWPGHSGPTYWLAARVQKRQLLLRQALPDALDMLVLCLEGGASVPAALQCVTDELQAAHPALGAEMNIVQGEMQLGLSAGVAMRQFADRCGLTDVRDLAARLLASYPAIDALANNAGGIVVDYRRTPDGLESTIQSNHLAPFLLTNLLRHRLSGAVGAVCALGDLRGERVPFRGRHVPGTRQLAVAAADALVDVV